MRSLNYLIRSGLHFFNEKSCPYCGMNKHIRIDQKYIVTQLHRCLNCGLMYRTPKDKENFNEAFYNEVYKEKGLTTDLPDSNTLQELVRTNFINSEKDFSFYISILKLLKQKRDLNLILDYGANWGYGSMQFRKAGFNTQSYEISKSRANFGKTNLNIDIKYDFSELKNGNDLFFSAHVIEHLNDIPSFINNSRKLLNPNGLFFAACPNGSEAFKINNESRFHLAWGLVHPNYISEKFYQYVFRENPYLISSQTGLFELVESWNYSSQVIGDLSGSELFVIAMPNIKYEKN